MRILIVEDNPGDVRLVQETLRHAPSLEAELAQVDRLGAAREYLETHPQPDVVLLDLGLPDAHDFDAVRAIVAVAPAIPIVVLTGRDDEDVGFHAVREGAQDFLIKKDLEAGTLVRAIRYAIERKRLQRTERFLAELEHALSATMDYEETLRRLAEQAIRGMGDFCAIDVVTDDTSIQRVGVSHGDPGNASVAADLMARPVTLDRPPLRDAAAHGSVVLVPRISPAHLDEMCEDAEQLAFFKGIGLTSYLAIPLLSHEQLIGAITFYSTTRAFDDEDRVLAEKIGRIAAPELANAYLYKHAQDAIRARDRVLAIVAHDLRNPLSAISMSAELLLDPGFNDEQRMRQILTIRRSTDRMDRLIQDLLDVARIESDQLQLRLDYESPTTVMREAVELNQVLAEAKELALEMVGDGTTLSPICVDRGRILQVLTNVIGNSVKFTPEGGRITARVAEEGDEVVFSISDTGPGILEEDQAHLFTPFWQARRLSSDGAGLGLSIARGIVAAHGGRIWVESVANVGTTISFTIPVSADRRGDTGEVEGADALIAEPLLQSPIEADATPVTAIPLPRRSATLARRL